jgi:hypothetical protein
MDSSTDSREGGIETCEAWAELEGLVGDLFPSAAEKSTDSDNPPDPQNGPSVTQRTGWKDGLEAMEAAEVPLFRIVGCSPLKEVNSQILVSLTGGIPEDGSFHRLEFGGIHGVDLIVADEQVPGVI